MATSGRPRRFRHLVVVGDGVRVCVDSAEENMVPAMALNAEYVLDGAWNGWARPVATAGAFEDFLAHWRANDRHGTSGQAMEVGSVLRYEGTDGDEPENFPRVGTSTSGAALYDFTGWVWVVI